MGPFFVARGARVLMFTWMCCPLRASQGSVGPCIAVATVAASAAFCGLVLGGVGMGRPPALVVLLRGAVGGWFGLRAS